MVQNGCGICNGPGIKFMAEMVLLRPKILYSLAGRIIFLLLLSVESNDLSRNNR
jgi:hypothetical protein